ncbi:hypothetical protein [Sphingomonas sp. R1]|uniref:hypothetical protein n=1 Tax=Sphingomonas sp. R1 TaxID=399176 RepID=UPI0022258F81|nr:hypothetical protein [Sphingomonas sp. R1]UYY76828.1 hypothetical protein OIM94_15155 [Sphingomonas sp. R1]
MRWIVALVLAALGAAGPASAQPHRGSYVIVTFLAYNWERVPDGYVKSDAPFSHAFVEIERLHDGKLTKEYYGFSHDDDANNYAIVFAMAQGKLNESPPINDREVYPYLTKSISEGQYAQLKDFIASWKEAAPNYGVFTWNCVTFAAYMARNIGLKTPPTFGKPEAFMQEMLRINGSDVRTPGIPNRRLTPSELDRVLKNFQRTSPAAFRTESAAVEGVVNGRVGKAYAETTGRRASAVKQIISNNNEERARIWATSSADNSYAASRTRLDEARSRAAVQADVDHVRGGSSPGLGGDQTLPAPTTGGGSGGGAADPIDPNCGFMCIRERIPRRAQRVGQVVASGSGITLSLAGNPTPQDGAQLIVYLGPKAAGFPASFDLIVKQTGTQKRIIAALPSGQISSSGGDPDFPESRVVLEGATPKTLHVSLLVPQLPKAGELLPETRLDLVEGGIVLARVYVLVDVFPGWELDVDQFRTGYTSGFGKALNEPYYLDMGPPPWGYHLLSYWGELRSEDARHSRHCGFHAECDFTDISADQKRFTFKAEGHDGGICVFCEDPGKRSFGFQAWLHAHYSLINYTPEWLSEGNATGPVAPVTTNALRTLRNLHPIIQWPELPKPTQNRRNQNN